MSPVPELRSHLGYLMRAASNAVSHAFARSVAAEGVTVAEWAMMRVLYDADAVAPTVLADRMGMTKGAVSKLAERLVAKGLVLRTHDPEDRRTHRLSLTGRGREATPALAALADANDAAFFGVLSAEEMDRLRALLERLIERHRLHRIPTE